MVLVLHVWGPAFGLPSIDAECLATIAYLQRIVPQGEWHLIADYDTSVSSRREFPALVDGHLKTTGFSSIVSYLRNHRSGAYDLDYNLTHQQQTDRTAFLSLLESTAAPLIDLYLYVCSENYNATTSSAYTAILPWYANYTIPPRRRDLARARTAYMGLGGLDVQMNEETGSVPGSASASAEFEAAKRAAGHPSESQSKAPSVGRRRGIGGLLGAPIYAARFKLDTLSSELLEPLSDLLGKKDYLLEGDKPSSLDCLCFGYVGLLFYPPVPQAWLKETIQAKYPRIASYIRRLRGELLGNEEVNPGQVWAISIGLGEGAEKNPQQSNMHLPWRPRPNSLSSRAIVATREILASVPVLSSLQQDAIIQVEPLPKPRHVTSSLPSPLLVNSMLGLSATFAAVFAGLAIHHRRSPRDGPLIFWALRPNVGGGEAENIFNVLSQLPTGTLTSF